MDEKNFLMISLGILFNIPITAEQHWKNIKAHQKKKQNKKLDKYTDAFV